MNSEDIRTMNSEDTQFEQEIAESAEDPDETKYKNAKRLLEKQYDFHKEGWYSHLYRRDIVGKISGLRKCLTVGNAGVTVLYLRKLNKITWASSLTHTIACLPFHLTYCSLFATIAVFFLGKPEILIKLLGDAGLAWVAVIYVGTGITTMIQTVYNHLCSESVDC